MHGIRQNVLVRAVGHVQQFLINRFKVGLWGPAFGGRVVSCDSDVCTQQEAELDCLTRGLRFIVNVGWSAFRLAGDNVASVDQIMHAKWDGFPLAILE